MKSTLYIQHAGKEITDKEIISRVKEIWVEEGNKIKDIDTLETYIKPEELMIYYVINKTFLGSFPF